MRRCAGALTDDRGCDCGCGIGRQWGDGGSNGLHAIDDGRRRRWRLRKTHWRGPYGPALEIVDRKEEDGADGVRGKAIANLLAPPGAAHVRVDARWVDTSSGKNTAEFSALLWLSSDRMHSPVSTPQSMAV